MTTTEQSRCEGCDALLATEGAGLIMERHLSYVGRDGHLSGPEGAVLVVQLCLPCAWRHLHQIERAIARIIREGRGD